MSDIIIEVHDAVGRYKDEKPTDPHSLLDYQAEFAGLAFYLAGQVGHLHEDYLGKEYVRKREHGRYINNFDGAIGKAKEAVYYQLPYYNDEKKAEGYYQSAKLILAQLNTIITSIGVKVAFLRSELNKTS